MYTYPAPSRACYRMLPQQAINNVTTSREYLGMFKDSIAFMIRADKDPVWQGVKRILGFTRCVSIESLYIFAAFAPP